MASQPLPLPLQLLSRHCGLALGGRQNELMRYIEARALLLGYRSTLQYVEAVLADGGEEASALLEQVTVLHSWLFRDAEQLELAIELLRQAPPAQVLEVWVPGCASGEDAYALAMAAEQRGLRVQILGTDISPRAIQRARTAQIAAESMRSLPAEMRQYLQETRDGFLVDQRIRRSVRLAVHNVLSPAPRPLVAHGFTLVLCRNVLLHFTPESIQLALSRMSAALLPGGTLLLGAAEYELGTPELELTKLRNRCLLRKRGGLFTSPLPTESQLSAASAPLATAAALSAPKPALPPQPAESAQLRRAAQELQAGKLEAARRTLSELLRSAPDCGDALLLAGIADYMVGDYEQAIPKLRAALHVDGELWPAELYLALAFGALHDIAAASLAYERLLTLRKSARRRPGSAVELLELESLADDLVALAKAQLRMRTGKI